LAASLSASMRQIWLSVAVIGGLLDVSASGQAKWQAAKCASP
jgi:hypothetical protein